MSENKTPAQVQKRTVAQFVNIPATQKFLEDNLQEKKGEFVSNLISLVESDTNLSKCDPKDLMMCAMNATALNLPLNKNLGFAYVIPYGDRPQFQIGYKGLIQLAIRTGAYKYINAVEVRDGEIDRNKFTGEMKFKGEKPENKVVGYVAYLELMTGFSASIYMTEAEIESHALRFSKMYQADRQYKTAKSKWSDPSSRPKMAMKTVLKMLLGTYGLMTTELIRAFESDGNEDEQITARQFDEAEIVTQNEPTERKESEQEEPQQTIKL